MLNRQVLYSKVLYSIYAAFLIISLSIYMIYDKMSINIIDRVDHSTVSKDNKIATINMSKILIDIYREFTELNTFEDEYKNLYNEISEKKLINLTEQEIKEFGIKKRIIQIKQNLIYQNFLYDAIKDILRSNKNIIMLINCYSNSCNLSKANNIFTGSLNNFENEIYMPKNMNHEKFRIIANCKNAYKKNGQHEDNIYLPIKDIILKKLQNAKLKNYMPSAYQINKEVESIKYSEIINIAYDALIG